MSHKLLFTVIAFALCITTKGHAQEKWQSEEIFSVNNRPVTAQEFMYVYKKNNEQNENAFTKDDILNYFDLYKKFKLKVEEAYQQNVDDQPDFVKEFNSYKKEFVKPFLSEQKAIDELAEEAYKRMQLEVHAAHILIAVNDPENPIDTLHAYELIDSIRNLAIQNPDSFESLAMKYSQDPSAARNKGDLGYFSALQMVYPFENAAYETASGDISDIVKTRFGYHILKVYDKRPSKGQFQLAHIMLRFPRGAHEDSYGAAKIKEIYTQLNEGGDWNNLAAQFSTDSRTKNNGGELPPLQYGQIPDSFKPVIDKLSPGEYSEPFTSPYGWHIVKLIKVEPIKPFEEIKDELAQKIERDSRATSKKKALISELKQRFNVEIADATYNKLKGAADVSLTNGKWSAVKDTSFHQLNLIKIDGNWRTSDDFLAFVRQKQRPAHKQNPEKIFDLLFQQYQENQLLNYEESYLAKHNTQYKQLLREYKEGLMLFEVMENNVWNKAIEDTTGLRQYYDNHTKEYMYGERVDAVVYSMGDSSLLADIKKAAQKEVFTLMDTCFSYNDSETHPKAILHKLGNIYRQYDHTSITIYTADTTKEADIINTLSRSGIDKKDINVLKDVKFENKVALIAKSTSKKSLEHEFNKESALNLQVNEGLFEKDDLSILKSITWTPGEITLTKNDRFYLIDIKEVLSPSEKPLSATRGKVISDYQEVLEDQWLDQLKAKYDIDVNRKILKKTIKYLENK